MKIQRYVGRMQGNTLEGETTGLSHEGKHMWKSRIKHKRTGKPSLRIKPNLCAYPSLSVFLVYSVSGDRIGGLTELKVLLEQICIKQAPHQQKRIKKAAKSLKEGKRMALVHQPVRLVQ